MGEQSPSLQVPEAEEDALPAPDIGRPWPSGDWAKWLTAAVLLFVVAGGYWAFSQNHRARLEQARVLAETKRQMAEGEANPTAEPRAAEDAQRRALAAAGAAPDGLYAGPVCYGPAAADPPRCFRAQ